MVDNQEVVEAFYQAFADKDAQKMAQIYSDDVFFSDPVFPDLRGERARNMWRMLCGGSPDLTVKCTKVERIGSEKVLATWVATYHFTATGRIVTNYVTAHLLIKGGKIIRHQDDFNFWRWARQALGPVGLLLGWSPRLRNKIRQTAASRLQKFEASLAVSSTTQQ